jgi:cell division protein FtsL
MKKVKMNWVLVVTMALIMFIPLVSMASEAMTVEGEVNDNFQIVDANGQVFEVADTTQGNDLVENHIGEKAKVVGTVEQDQEVKIITITSFEILAE